MHFSTLLGALAATTVAVASAQHGRPPPPPPPPAFPHCSPKDLAVLSCHNTTAVNTCCSEYPGGLVLLTQFWDYAPAKGPKDSWTVHGLWPDFCDGTYPEYCDVTREYESPLAVLKKFKAFGLIKYMEKYWKDQAGDDNDFWKHEFDKHGTCMSTLEPECYGRKYETGEEAVEYFQTTVDLFKKLDSFKWLKKCGIVPSTTKTYKIADIEECLSDKFGAVPFVGCADGNINEIWYYHHLRGKISKGKYEATASTRASSCPAEGVKYIPK